MACVAAVLCGATFPIMIKLYATLADTLIKSGLDQKQVCASEPSCCNGTVYV